MNVPGFLDRSVRQIAKLLADGVRLSEIIRSVTEDGGGKGDKHQGPSYRASICLEADTLAVNAFVAEVRDEDGSAYPLLLWVAETTAPAAFPPLDLDQVLHAHQGLAKGRCHVRRFFRAKAGPGMARQEARAAFRRLKGPLPLTGS